MSIDSGNTTININNVIKSTLRLEEYFILDCLNKKNRLLLEDYVRSCGIIEKSRFDNLFNLGYIEAFDAENIVFDGLKLTSKALKILGWDKSFEDYFKELREVYPKQAGKSGRQLHKDLPRCKKLYKEIVDCEETHNLIIKCIKMDVEHHRKNGKLEYLQMLPTFLHQRNYEAYLEEVKNIKEFEDSGEHTNLESI